MPRWDASSKQRQAEHEHQQLTLTAMDAIAQADQCCSRRGTKWDNAGNIWDTYFAAFFAIFRSHLAPCCRILQFLTVLAEREGRQTQGKFKANSATKSVKF
jgi:hypothetical protein